jgi:hypothetical protein
MMEDMAMRGLRSDTQHEYIRFVRSFAAFLGQPPDTATAEDVRRFQVHQRESGVQPCATASRGGAQGRVMSRRVRDGHDMQQERREDLSFNAMNRRFGGGAASPDRRKEFSVTLRVLLCPAWRRRSMCRG